MWGSAARIIGSSLIASTLQFGFASLSARAGEPEERPRDATNATVAAALPLALPQSALMPRPQSPQDPSGGDTVPPALGSGDPDMTGAASPPPPDTGGASETETPAPPRLGQKDRGGEPASDPTVKAALKARLEARSAPGSHGAFAYSHRKQREAIAAFYIGRDFAPLWFTDGQPDAEVEPVLARLAKAHEDGLDLEGFPLPSIPAGGIEELAAADLALTDAVVAFGRQASGSRIDPSTISRLIGARPEVADPAIILAIVATAGKEAGTALEGFNPPHAAYAALRDKLDQLRRHRAPAAAREPAIPAGPLLRVGMRDPRVPLIRARLSLEDAPAEATEGSLYDTHVAAAVASFQKANGLPGSGTLTAQTAAVLSGARPSRLEAEVLANMERWRWMPRDLGASRIEVNIPDFEATIIENGRVVNRYRVVVGKEETPTPVFSEEMRFLIVNPYWNLPPSIIRNEYASDPARMRRHGYEVFSRNGRLVVRQPPGERNALGRIKFMFPNDYAVYLHDTPSRALFDETRRAYSHGCVRVDDPFRFAETVLGGGWSEARLRKLIGGKERYVHMPKPLPVHIEYFTAYVDASGQLQTREDLYGYSRRVRAALGLEG